MLDILSAPTTTTFLHFPVSMNCEPVATAKRNPEQAAPKSYPHAFFAPILSQIILAVAGNKWSGVTVAQMSKSMSIGEIPRFSHSTFTASTAMSLVPNPSPFRMCRSEIPVRERIHSSLVSTIFSKSAFVRMSGGR